MTSTAIQIIKPRRLIQPQTNIVAMELQGVTKTHTGKHGTLNAVEALSMKVFKGEFLCILGSSGCGKSTLLNLMAGLDHPTNGLITLHGKPVSRPGTDRVVIFQEAGLFPWLNILENVEFGLKFKQIPAKERREKAMQALELVHLQDFAKAYAHQLSGGMKQRAAIARGLVLDPEMLLMDEPFAALDAQTRDVLHNELQEIWTRTQKTIVFVTHNVREAACLGTRILLMSARPGRISKEYPVDIPRPRQIEDEPVIEIARQVREGLRQEVSKAERKKF
jgi:NitT/TauT family transport system ATP-binding protein